MKQLLFYFSFRPILFLYYCYSISSPFHFHIIIPCHFIPDSYFISFHFISYYTYTFPVLHYSLHVYLFNSAEMGMRIPGNDVCMWMEECRQKASLRSCPAKSFENLHLIPVLQCYRYYPWLAIAPGIHVAYLFVCFFVTSCV
jgi:hypothetical protein